MASPITRKDRSHDDGPQQSVETQVLISSPSASSPTAHDAVRLWLRWNEAYETATSRMFEVRSDPQALQDEMDHMEELRRQAITISQELLEHSNNPPEKVTRPTSD